jgi:hypothetical protein
VTGRLIRITTALAVAAVAAVAAVISYQHAYELVCSDGESGLTARLVPFTVDGAQLGGQHADPGRQPTPPAGTGTGVVVPRRRHHRHRWCRPDRRSSAGRASVSGF